MGSSHVEQWGAIPYVCLANPAVMEAEILRVAAEIFSEKAIAPPHSMTWQRGR